MAQVAHEHHTYFLDPARYRAYQAWASGEVTFGGIGVQLQGPHATIIDVDEGTPAARADLVPGDELVQVDGVDLAGLSPLQVADLVRGPLGSSVELVVRRRQTELATLQVRRESIQLPAVAPQQLGDIGYIRLRGFAEPSVVDALEQAVTSLQAKGVHGLIIDLRDNRAGRLDLGARLLGDFLPAGTTLFEQVDRSGAPRTYVAEEGAGASPLPLLLVGSQTQSMGEVFAVALHEYGATTLEGDHDQGQRGRWSARPARRRLSPRRDHLRDPFGGGSAVE